MARAIGYEAREIAETIVNNAKRKKKILNAKSVMDAARIVDGFIVAECREKKIKLTNSDKINCNLEIRDKVKKM